MKVVCGVKVGNMKDRDADARGKVGIIEFPIKELGPDEVKIKVAYCSICGSDPHIVGGAFGLEPPFGLGHEMSGVVVELGSAATKRGLKVGDRVSGNFLHYCGACRPCLTGNQEYCKHASNQPCMAEYVVWHEAQVVKIPQGVSLLQGCMLEPLSIGVRILDRCQMQVGKRVLVSGGGPIGLITCQLFKKFGASSLTLSEPNPQRRDIAKSIGVEFTINPIEEDLVARGMEITGGDGYDVIVEVSGIPSAAESVLKLAAYDAHVLYSAMFSNEYRLPLNLFEYCYNKGVHITGTYCSHYNFERAAQILPSMDFSAFLGEEQIFAIDDCEQAFAAHLSGKYPKIIIRCNDFENEEGGERVL
ncbi:zinc-dependent alcohol dehydrogenase [Sphaerochaeta sp.]|jgi:(R,R)-butanediol dehydrogenase/meso-butanediol dehydrogenase/diacetyl reductase/L-iditol 2-dehydrogenase|uniref:zinc-dependent alcohol dehydrogenase n=1 Tax=Sphaerochaeta sp. TaxID=1972642 RepID=UPI002A365136|nr:alcohol dehydrogenase catalytic domain-containing protein [Sphaerochaeta sp.]MDX9984563.1 alcohol dehydrogenase catalytic domain-containing protein [Sphaerochaeta sp.]